MLNYADAFDSCYVPMVTPPLIPYFSRSSLQVFRTPKAFQQLKFYGVELICVQMPIKLTAHLTDWKPRDDVSRTSEDEADLF